MQPFDLHVIEDNMKKDKIQEIYESMLIEVTLGPQVYKAIDVFIMYIRDKHGEPLSKAEVKQLKKILNIEVDRLGADWKTYTWESTKENKI